MRIDYPIPGQIPQLRRLWQQVFGDSDDFLNSFFRTAFSPDRCRCVMMEKDIAAVLYWMDCALEDQKLAYLYAVATHPSCRGQGLCRQLMENTHNLLCARGYAGVILVPQDEQLRTMYRKMGYQNAGGLQEITCTATAAPICAEAIGPEEFAVRRRRLLPPNAVVQEGDSLVFLAEQLQFYAGTDFLLAGFADAGIFHGTELLGNTGSASSILQALGCQRGIFRCPGGNPFAMFHPLADDAILPGYFCFAFD